MFVLPNTSQAKSKGCGAVICPLANKAVHSRTERAKCSSSLDHSRIGIFVSPTKILPTAKAQAPDNEDDEDVEDKPKGRDRRQKNPRKSQEDLDVTKGAQLRAVTPKQDQQPKAQRAVSPQPIEALDDGVRAAAKSQQVDDEAEDVMSIDESDNDEPAILQALDCLDQYAELVMATIRTEPGKSVDSDERLLHERHRVIGAEDEALTELENWIGSAWLRGRSMYRLVTRDYAEDDNTMYW
ncbi:hypothetical protein BDY17DRAFT_344100 [Neohortaea acidophila]|uniref:Uncharacterized protein n=1 Tax=Neohortaea acidophila TaxID=245834 RepID=A0A6A6Q1A3_9PEZI|nr:uncharacterized protein BDY17DRAFT_344100 [Neohortaea acidophila]KAF2485207.1 hypothetical protein BDY17DRAFT_344100 [Neohortaea acidophila]